MNRLFISLIVALTSHFAVSAEKPRIISVVHGETSLTSPSELTFTHSRARGVLRALESVGVTAKLFSDKDLTAALASPCRVAHLVFMDLPSEAQRTRIKRFCDSGGKIIVHSSSSKELAAMMGLSKPTIVTANPTVWVGFQFADARPLNAPEFLKNRATQIIETVPVAKSSKIAALWVDENGKKGPIALLKTPRGYWLTRVLMDDGDTESQGRFLAALSADGFPEVWRLAAKRLDAEMWQPLDAESFEAAKTKLRASVRAEKRPALEDQIASLSYLVASKEADFSRGLFGASMTRLWSLRHVVERAYAAANKTALRTGILAVWDRNGTGLFPGDWVSTATVLKKAGVTDLYLMTASPGCSNTQVPGLAESFMKKKYGDQLSDAVKACHQYGIRIHAWIPALTIESMPTETKRTFMADGRGLVNAKGAPVEWIDPTDPRNVREITRIALWLAENTGVDGIHFDYMRYPIEESAMGSADKKNFERWLGSKVASWPTDVRAGGKLKAKYNEWRAEHITLVVKQVGSLIKTRKPKTLVSVAVYSFGNTNGVGQDWHSWIKNSLVDYVVPMNYTPDATSLKKMLERQIGAAESTKIVCGIGVTSFEANLNAIDVINQMNAAAPFKLKGIALYHLDERFKNEILPALELAK